MLFSVTPFKMDQNKIKTVQQIKSRIWENKECNYAPTLAKIQVTAIFLMQDMHKSHVGAHPDGHQHGSRKLTETKASIYLSRISRTLTWYFFQYKNYSDSQIPRNKSLFNQPGRHENAASCKSLEIQAFSLPKPRTHSEKNGWILVFSCCYTSIK